MVADNMDGLAADVCDHLGEEWLNRNVAFITTTSG